MKNRLFMALMFVFLLVGQSLWAGNWKAKHVVLIGLDGWGAYSVEKAEMPNVKRLMAEGSYTLKKRSVLPVTRFGSGISRFVSFSHFI